MIDGFEKLFGYKCDILAKILYATMTKGKDQSKITFNTFVENLYGLVDTSNLDNATRCVFNLLDVKSKGQLDIFLLIQIINNMDRNTQFVQELLIMIREHKAKNVMVEDGIKRKITLNFSKYIRLIPKSCLIDEFQFVFWGTYVPKKAQAEIVIDALDHFLDSSFKDPSKKFMKGRNIIKSLRPPELKRRTDSRLRRDDETIDDHLFRLRLNQENPPPLEVSAPPYSPFEVVPNLDREKYEEMRVKFLAQKSRQNPKTDYMMTT